MLELLLPLALLAGIGGSADVLAEHCDLIELNHFYDGEGRHVFTQVIFWDWSPSESCFQVRAWRMAISTGGQAPPSRKWRVKHEHAGDQYVARGIDQGHVREVIAPLFRESWTQYDPELVERDFLPKERRRGLRHEPRP